MLSPIEVLEPRVRAEAFASLTKVQARQIWKQVRVQWDGVEFEEISLPDFRVSLQYDRDVMRPYSSRAMAYWISRHPHVVQGKRVLDMGCGTGIQGIVSMMAGARHVEFADVIGKSIEMSELNVRMNLGAGEGAGFIKSDLFESMNADSKYDVIIFAQPYFSGQPSTDLLCTFGMLMPAPTIEKFMRDAHEFLESGGRLLMQAWDFGSKENDPRLLAKRFGWQLEGQYALDAAQPVQQGAFELTILTH